MNRNLLLLCAALVLFYRPNTGSVNNSNVDTISGTWSDDYVADDTLENGWYKFGGNGGTHATKTTGDSGTYWRSTKSSSSNQDKHQYMGRFFKCEAESVVSATMKISACNYDSGDHFRVYQLAYDGSEASSATYSTITLDGLSASTMPDDGTMNTSSDAVSADCDAWTDYNTLNLTYNFTVKNGEDYEDTVAADTPWEILVKFKMGATTDFALLWDMEITCDELVVPTDEPTTDPTGNPSADPTKAPTTMPTDPTADPTADPTQSPTTGAPTEQPTTDPTDDPTKDPTIDPTMAPSTDPTTSPTTDPTMDPTTGTPTSSPSNDPSMAPTDPTTNPTAGPTNATPEPTNVPTSPTNMPTVDPTVSPTSDPTTSPTEDPTAEPTMDPTKAPTSDPTTAPSMDPTTPTPGPTTNPTDAPTTDPTVSPTDPTADPTVDPTKVPTVSPTDGPSVEPTTDPTVSPSVVPTNGPSMAPTFSPIAGGSDASSGSGGSSGFDEVDWRSLALGAILASLFICCLFWILIFIFWKKRNESSTDVEATTEMQSTAGTV